MGTSGCMQCMSTNQCKGVARRGSNHDLLSRVFEESLRRRTLSYRHRRVVALHVSYNHVVQQRLVLLRRSPEGFDLEFAENWRQLTACEHVRIARALFWSATLQLRGRHLLWRHERAVRTSGGVRRIARVVSVLLTRLTSEEATGSTCRCATCACALCYGCNGKLERLHALCRCDNCSCGLRTVHDSAGVTQG